MSVVVVATIVPLPEHRDEVIATITETVGKVHEEDGCELYALHQTDDRLMMVEKWASPEALRAHSKGAALAAQAPRLAGKLAGPAEVIVLQAVPAATRARASCDHPRRARHGRGPRYRRGHRRGTGGGRVARRSGGPVRRRHSSAVRARVARRAGPRGRRRLRSGSPGPAMRRSSQHKPIPATPMPWPAR